MKIVGMGETGIDIANDIMNLFARTYWSESSLTVDGRIPKVKAFDSAQLADRIESAAKRAEDRTLKVCQALKRMVDWFNDGGLGGEEEADEMDSMVYNAEAILQSYGIET